MAVVNFGGIDVTESINFSEKEVVLTDDFKKVSEMQNYFTY